MGRGFTAFYTFLFSRVHRILIIHSELRLFLDGLHADSERIDWRHRGRIRSLLNHLLLELLTASDVAASLLLVRFSDLVTGAASDLLILVRTSRHLVARKAACPEIVGLVRQTQRLLLAALPRVHLELALL